MYSFKQYKDITISAINQWQEDKGSQMGAALAFYSLLSIGPLLLIAIAIAGLVFGKEAASAQIVGQIKGLIGEQSAEAIQTILANNQNKDSGILATLIGLATLLFSASAVFAQLQDSLNVIWKAKARKGHAFLYMLRERFISFSMVLGTGFLMLTSLLISAILAALGKYFVGWLPSLAPLLEIINIVVSFGIALLLFAMIFKMIPDVKIDWKDVWLGAFITALLFTIGKFLIGLYLGRSGISSAYGAAGSFIVLSLWVYYSSQIVFLGAEFTQSYARQYGSLRTVSVSV
jgi:membrane protein